MMSQAMPAAMNRSPMLTSDEWPPMLGMVKMSPMNQSPCGCSRATCSGSRPPRSRARMGEFGSASRGSSTGMRPPKATITIRFSVSPAPKRTVPGIRRLNQTTASRRTDPTTFSGRPAGVAADNDSNDQRRCDDGEEQEHQLAGCSRFERLGSRLLPKRGFPQVPEREARSAGTDEQDPGHHKHEWRPQPI